MLIGARMSQLILLLSIKLWFFQALQSFQRNQLLSCPVYGVSHGLVSFRLLNPIDIRIVLIEHIYFAGVHELPVRADCRVRFLVTDDVL